MDDLALRFVRWCAGFLALLGWLGDGGLGPRRQSPAGLGPRRQSGPRPGARPLLLLFGFRGAVVCPN